MLHHDRGPEYYIKITIVHENDPSTSLFINDAYHASKTDENTLELNGQYLFFTGDGILLFPDWPQTITMDEQEHFSFTPKFHAQYSVMHDISHQAYFQNTPKDDIQICLEKRENNDDLITVGQDTVLLSSNMALRLVDTPFNDILKGHSRNNRLTSCRGNDILEGKGGQDVYDIQQPENVGRTVWINNKDTAEYPEYDLLMLPVPLSQISDIQATGQDIVLSSRYEPDKNLKIRFQNFLQDESYRHITILDSKNHLFELNVDDKGQAYLGDPPGSLFPTGNADTLIITDGDILENHQLNALEGSDVIMDKSDYHYSLYGGEGDDMMMTLENGNKKLYGDEGHDQLFSGPGDDILTGGKGNDWLSGGDGNDQYFVYRLDGNTTIEDKGGEKDILVLPDIDANELCFTKVKEDIYITLKNTSCNLFSIKLKAWGSAPEKK